MKGCGIGVHWAAVDLYVKRLGLEPYFQLSKPEGATVRHSIFLNYPFGLIAFVLINAARNGCVLVHIRLVRDNQFNGMQAWESVLVWIGPMLHFLGHYPIEQVSLDYPECDTRYRDLVQATQEAPSSQ